MKKVFAIAALTFINLSSANAAENKIVYAPFTVAAKSDATVDLANGTPQGLRPNTIYNMSCTSSARDSVKLSFDDKASIQWANLTSDGVYLPSTFVLPANASINFIYFINDANNKTTLTIHNLSSWYHKVDVVFTCSSVYR